MGYLYIYIFELLAISYKVKCGKENKLCKSPTVKNYYADFKQHLMSRYMEFCDTFS